MAQAAAYLEITVLLNEGLNHPVGLNNGFSQVGAGSQAVLSLIHAALYVQVAALVGAETTLPSARSFPFARLLMAVHRRSY